MYQNDNTQFIDKWAVKCGKKRFGKSRNRLKGVGRTRCTKRTFENRERVWSHSKNQTSYQKLGQRQPFKRCPSTRNKIFKHYSLGTCLTPSPGGASFLLATSAMMCVSDDSCVNYGRPTEHHQQWLSRAEHVRNVVPLSGGTVNYHVRWAGSAHAKRLPIRRNGKNK